MSGAHLRYQGTSIAAAPTFAGVAGRAWRLTLAPLGQRGRPDFDGTVGLFIVCAPGAHLLWDHWILSVIHLRPIDGVKPAVKQFDAATHEFMIVSLDPEQPLPTLEVVPGWRAHFLTPIDVVEQFAARDDATADQILELAARAVVDGLASPDQDWRRWWTGALGETAQRFADGTHRVQLQ